MALLVLVSGVGGVSLCEAQSAPDTLSSAQARPDSLARGAAGSAARVAADSTTQKEREALKEIKSEMARIGRSEVPGERRWERQKSAKIALFSSMALPGLGQLYNGRKWKTAIAVGVFSYYLGTSWLERKQAQEFRASRDALAFGSLPYKQQNLLYEFHRDNAVTYLWWSGAAWLITALDAWIDAHLYDVRAVSPAVVRGGSGTKYVTFSVQF